MEAATAFLDGCPTLELSLWYAGHQHGRARAEVWLALDDGKGDLSSWLQGELKGKTEVTKGIYCAAIAVACIKCPSKALIGCRLMYPLYGWSCLDGAPFGKGACLAQ